MCGICGVLALDGCTPPARHAIDAMSAALAHRGPDGEGQFRDGPVAVAARRLAVIDPPGGHQPAASEDGRVRVVLNGEIYNFAALRDELARRGHRLAGRGDTEVLAHLYEDHGPRLLSRLRGMFALAIWDARRRRLLLARDRFGIKPLLYALDDRRLAFASELRALLRLRDVPRALDPDALEQYLACNCVLGHRTMLRAVRRLPPGHLLLAGPEGVRVERWGRDLPAAAGALRKQPLPALAAEARERLTDSVRAHLVADVPVGVLLSGGVDSGGLAALAARELGAPLRTFTVGFDEPSFDELADARLVARRYGTDHRELVVGPEHATLLERVAGDADEPRGDATALPYWLAARLAARDVKVVLAGEGGDELFGGYPTYTAARLGAGGAVLAAALEPIVRRVPSSDRRLSLDFRLRRLARGAGLGPLERHHAFKEIFAAADRAALLRLRGRGSADPLAPHRAIWAATRGAEAIARLQAVDLGTFVADDLLLQTDRSGMAHGLEIRVPYLDPVVAEFARALPLRARLAGRQTKRVLRAALAPLLPHEVVRGPKRGFVTPAAAWLRGPLLPLAADVLSEATLRRQGLVDPAAAAALFDRHVRRREDVSRGLWALLALTLWHDAVLGRPAVADALEPPRPAPSAAAAVEMLQVTG
jgi:asparagine synthase (glutamine-hydrolysing)